MTKSEIREAPTSELRDRLSELNRRMNRYIDIGIGVFDTEQSADPDNLQEAIWIQNELMRREAADANP